MATPFRYRVTLNDSRQPLWIRPIHGAVADVAGQVVVAAGEAQGARAAKELMGGNKPRAIRLGNNGWALDEVS